MYCSGVWALSGVSTMEIIEGVQEARSVPRAASWSVHITEDAAVVRKELLERAHTWSADF